MGIKVNYLTLKNKESINIGQIEFFDSFIETNSFFPYFYMGEKSQVLDYANWPDLVPYFYEQKLKLININKETKELFPIYSFTANNGIIKLKFTNSDSIKICKILNEDRKMSFIDNNGYSEWKKTITPLSNITNGTLIFLEKDKNYYINNIIINENDVILDIISPQISNVTNEYILNNINLEFGPYRIPNKTFQESVLYNGTSAKYFINNNLDIFIGNLSLRSQIMGHTHEHTHNMNNHTHILNHTHTLSNHIHNMNHNHNYLDTVNITTNVMIGDTSYVNFSVFSVSGNNSRSTTNSNLQATDVPNINVTGQASNITTNSISNNLSGNIIEDDIKQNSNGIVGSLKIKNVMMPETYSVYAYIFGKRYLL